jgi:hypothetical protein
MELTIGFHYVTNLSVWWKLNKQIICRLHLSSDIAPFQKIMSWRWRQIASWFTCHPYWYPITPYFIRHVKKAFPSGFPSFKRPWWCNGAKPKFYQRREIKAMELTVCIPYSVIFLCDQN